MRKRLFLMLFAWINIGIFTMNLNAFSGNGNGDEDSPYLITSATELNEIRNNLDAHYKLMNNIDLTDWITENSPIEGWEPINEFKGVLDGNGFVISGLWIEKPEAENIGFFGSVAGAIIKRIGIVIPDNKKIVGKKYVGGLVGQTPYTTTEISIDECFVTGGTIESKDQAAGGILGYTSTNSVTVNIRNCYTANSTVISVDGTGGIVGTAYRNINIENCYSTNTIISANNDKAAGGIAGGFNDAKDSYTIKNSIALNPSIASSKSAGRIIGWIKDSSKTTLSNNYAFDGMSVDGKTLSGEATDNNGLDKSKEELNQQSTYVSLGWNFNVTDGVWIMGNENYTLPVLKNISFEMQPTITPDHLYVEVNPDDGFSGSGNGDENSPYLITSATELNEIRNNPEAHYKLMNNIDLTDWITENSPIEGWEPINEFKGVLDGNGFVISGLWIEKPEAENIGFFGSVAGAIIKRIGIVIPDNKKIVGKKYVGGLVGQTPYTTTEISIDECFVTGGTIESKDQAAGGILGYTSTNSVTVNIRNCYTANSTVISVDGTGGIVGTAYRNINIENCYSTNTIISANNDKAAGGIAGGFNDAKDSYTIKNSIALNPSIASSKSAGRIIGWIKDSSKTTLSNNYAFDGMSVDGKTLSGEATDNNGLDKSKEEVNEISIYTSLGWNFDAKEGIWAMGNGKYSLPVLKNVSMEQQPQITPKYLYISKPGDIDNPYLITTAAELNEIRNNPEAHYKLVNNIDLTNWITENSPIEGWEPINGFSGSLDGNGFIIYGLWIDRPAINNVGLFGSITGGVIKRTGIIIPDDKKIEGNNNVGGFVGHTPYTTAEISIDECFVAGGTIEAKSSAAGGILGYTSTNSTTVNIRNCYVANTTVLGADGAGGLVGTAYRSINVENCYSTGVVKSTNNDKSAGGLVGETNDQSENYTIKNSIALNSEIFSSKSAGRIVGWIKNSAKTTLNNYAFEGMLVDGKTLSGKIADNNGLNKSKEEVNDVATYLSLGWNFDEDGIWIMGNRKYTLPILKNVLAEQQPAVMPKHLEMSEPVGVLTEKGNKPSIYPTVTEGEIFITNKALSSIVSVYDFSGRTVMQSDKSMLDLSSLANGIYFVKVENEIIKVVKK